MDVGDEIRDYVLESRIGAGGAGEVWCARHRHIGKQVAIKIIYRNLSQDLKLRERVIREAAAMANLGHPYIVQLHEFFFLNDQPHLVMDYIDGGSLQSRIDDRIRLAMDETLTISRDILSALNYAHTKGVVHRDVKPANILLGQDGHAYITDFGTALMLGKTRTTQYGKTVGTPEYMSPEQIKGGRMDHRTDVYSYGCVLYEMLTGHPPYGSRDKDALTDFTIMTQHLNDTPVPVRKLNPSVDENMAAVVERALQKDPNLRPPGCAEMAALLGATKETPTEPVPQPGPSTPPAEVSVPGASPGRVSRPVWVLLIAAVGGLIIFLFSQQAEVPPQTPRYPTQFEREQTEEKKRREMIAEQKRIDADRKRVAEAERIKQERLAEQRRQAEVERRQSEAERIRQKKQAEQRRLAEQERGRQERIHELALKSFYRRFPSLKGRDPEATTSAEKWKKYLHCYAVVDYQFFERHPERGDRPLKRGEKELIDEWNKIKKSILACRSYR